MYELAFVDSIADAPTTRLNLNSYPWSTKGPELGTDFGMPSLRRAVVSTMLQDGEPVPAAAYGNRVITLVLDVAGALSDDDAVAQVQLLSRELDRGGRELDRAGNFLRYKPNTSLPVFFRTMRSDYQALQWDPVNRRATVTLLAEPFAFGLPTTLPMVRVNNDPLDPTPVNANPYFDTDASDWTPAGGTFVRSTVQAHEGTASGLLTPSGVAATSQVVSGRYPAAAGQTWRVSTWLYCAVARNVDVSIAWRAAGGALLSTSTGTFALTANTWTATTGAAAAPASTATAEIVVSMTGTPPASNLLYIDEAKLRQPVHGPGAMCFDVTGVPGDVAAEVRMVESNLAWYSTTTLLATRRRGTPANVPLVLHAEAMGQGTDTSTQPFDSSMSGLGNNFSRITFATDASLNPSRLTAYPFPAASVVDNRGTYRVLVRYRRSSSTGVINLKVNTGGDTNTSVLDTVATDLTTSRRIADFGTVSIPAGPDTATIGPSGVETVPVGLRIVLYAERLSGTATIDIDYILLVPASEQTTIIKVGGASIGDGYVVDSYADVIYGYTSINIADEVDSTPDLSAVGDIPTLLPGVTNRVYVIVGVGFSDNNSISSSQSKLTVTYWPRYLHVRPVAS